jgi:hypothetical protein
MHNYVHLANNKPFFNDSNTSNVFSFGILLRNHSMASLKENLASFFGNAARSKDGRDLDRSGSNRVDSSHHVPYP